MTGAGCDCLRFQSGLRGLEGAERGWWWKLMLVYVEPWKQYAEILEPTIVLGFTSVTSVADPRFVPFDG